MEQLPLVVVVAAASRQIIDTVLDELDRQLAEEEVRTPRYRVSFHERTGMRYEARVASRVEADDRIAEAFGANADIDFADVFTPTGDWLTRVGRDRSAGHLLAAPASDRPARRRVPCHAM